MLKTTELQATFRGALYLLALTLVLLTAISCSKEQQRKGPQIESSSEGIDGAVTGKTDSSALELAPVVIALVSKPNEARTLAARTFTSVIRGIQEAGLAVKRPGRIVALDVTLGERVVVGQTLVRLDSTLERLAVDAALAKRESAAAGAEQARRDLVRAEELFAESGLSESRLENVRLASQTANSIYDGAVAELGGARRQLFETRIVAPFDGEISRLPYDIGETPPPGGIVTEVTDRHQLIADIFLSAEEAVLISVGMEGHVSVMGDASSSRTGVLRAVSPKSNDVTKLFKGEVIIENGDLRLRSGVTTRVTFNLKSTNYPVAPLSAIIERGEQTRGNRISFVAVVMPGASSRDGDTLLRASLRPVTLGERVGAGVAILSGLDYGERIVVKGAETLSEEQPLRIVKEVSLDSLLY